MFDAPLALLCQLVAVGVDVVVGIDECTHDVIVACCRRLLIRWINRSAHIGVCKALRILNLLNYCLYIYCKGVRFPVT